MRESVNSAEPVRNQCAMNHMLILVDIGGGGGRWAFGDGCWLLAVAISAQPVRNQCGVCRLVRNQCVTSALSPTHQFLACDICEAFENMSNISAQLSS